MSHFTPDDSDAEVLFINREAGETHPQSTQGHTALYTCNRSPVPQRIEDDGASTVSYSSSVDQSVTIVERGQHAEPGDREAIQEMSRITSNLAGAVNKLVEELKNKPKPTCTSVPENPDPKRGGARQENRVDNDPSRFPPIIVDYRRQPPQENLNTSNNLHGDGVPAYEQCQPPVRYDRQFNRAPNHGRYERNWGSPDRMNRFNPYNRGVSGPVKMPAFTGKEDFSTWITRFETIAKRYNWSVDDKLDNLLPRIEGQAAEFVFSQLPPHLLEDYRELVQEMHSRYAVVETARSFAVQFSRRSQRYGETIEEYAADLKRLYDKAHGYRDRICRQEDLVRRFLDGLTDEDVRFEVEFHKEPRTIDEAVLHAANMLQMRNNPETEKRYRKGTRRALDEPYVEQAEGEPLAYRPTPVIGRGVDQSAYDFNPYTSGADKGTGQAVEYPHGYITRDYDEPRDRSVYRIQNSTEVNKQAGQNGRQEQHLSTGKGGLQMGTDQILLQIMETQKTLLDRIETLEREKGSNQRPRTARNTIECFHCHEQGHIARECPRRVYDNRNRNRQGAGRWQQASQEANANTQPLNGMGPALVTKGRSN